MKRGKVESDVLGGVRLDAHPAIILNARACAVVLPIDSYVVAVGKRIGQPQRWGWPFVDKLVATIPYSTGCTCVGYCR